MRLIALFAFTALIIGAYLGTPWLVIPSIITLAVLLCVGASLEGKRSQKSVADAFADVDGFAADQKNESGNHCLALDERRKKICIVYGNSQGRPGEAYVVSHKELVSVELLIGGTSVTTTSRGSQLGGAVVGGLLFGGVGAVIGGLSGKQETTTQNKTYELVITVDSLRRPIHRIHFPDDYTARHWSGIISTLIKHAGA